MPSVLGREGLPIDNGQWMALEKGLPWRSHG